MPPKGSESSPAASISSISEELARAAKAYNVPEHLITKGEPVFDEAFYEKAKNHTQAQLIEQLQAEI
jgi:hypothetical protein